MSRIKELFLNLFIFIIKPGINILAISPSPLGPGKNCQDFRKKKRGVGAKKKNTKNVIKHTLKYLYKT